MRPLQSLNFEAIVELLRCNFKTVADARDPRRISYQVSDQMMTAFAVFFFQHPSLLEFQARLQHKKGRNNLATMFGVREVSSATQLRENLDEVEAEAVRRLLPVFFEKLRRAGWAHRFQSAVSSGEDAGSYYVMALDGTQYFDSTLIGCPNCLQRRDTTGVLHHWHLAVGATIVKAGSHRVLPVDAEVASPQDGSEKQDCESAAAKRLLERVRREHRQLSLIVTADDLHAHVPFVELCEALRMKYVVVCKPTSHEERFEWVDELERMGESEWVRWVVGPACQRQSYAARVVRAVPLRADDAVYTTLVEVWQRNRAGEVVYHNSWVTNLAVTSENVAEIVLIGRAKWKIENEQFNVQKNGGYHLEHSFGHGKKNLSAVFYYLNLVAYVSHLMLGLGCQLFRAVQARSGSRASLWNDIKTLVSYFVWESWQALLRHLLDDTVATSP